MSAKHSGQSYNRLYHSLSAILAFFALLLLLFVLSISYDSGLAILQGMLISLIVALTILLLRKTNKQIRDHFRKILKAKLIVFFSLFIVVGLALFLCYISLFPGAQSASIASYEILQQVKIHQLNLYIQPKGTTLEEFLITGNIIFEVEGTISSWQQIDLKPREINSANFGFLTKQVKFNPLTAEMDLTFTDGSSLSGDLSNWVTFTHSDGYEQIGTFCCYNTNVKLDLPKSSFLFPHDNKIEKSVIFGTESIEWTTYENEPIVFGYLSPPFHYFNYQGFLGLIGGVSNLGEWIYILFGVILLPILLGMYSLITQIVTKRVKDKVERHRDPQENDNEQNTIFLPNGEKKVVEIKSK